MIYLDNAATTKIHPEVLKAMMPYLTERYGNPGTLYRLGREAHDAVEKAREQVAAFMGVSDPNDIIFTSGATEGNNAVFTAVDYRYDYVLISDYEHDSVIHAARERDILAVHQRIDKGTGTVMQDDLDFTLGSYVGLVGLVSIMAVNNETGSRNNVKELCEVAHRHGALFHTDFTQGAGEYEINAEQNGYDFVTISGHKIHAPKGIGALYISKDARKSFAPLIYGGEMQEHGLRGGTENVASIVGLGKACELIQGKKHNYEKLHDAFYETLLKEKISFSPNYDAPEYSNNKIINIRFYGVQNSALLAACAERGVCISAGSACTGQGNKPSHVLLALGMSEEAANESVRISFSDMNTMEEVSGAVHIIAESVRNLQKLKKYQ